MTILHTVRQRVRAFFEEDTVPESPGGDAPASPQTLRELNEIRQLASSIKLREPEESSQYRTAAEIRSQAFIGEVAEAAETEQDHEHPTEVQS
ncbi:hypothetical protein SAMN05216226_102151 [Halovenus aranensis]|uniref:Uncharacterized protein n=1 Tax=Halovenus aranensis TaxID=890420 RepID=A0A1G8SUN6_9EURY|nr:hypothetical protein [Halovenus aranensis]SDJ32873.1 hypothetical protein SAMN05216226_102151 [Halovenus aranensis]